MTTKRKKAAPKKLTLEQLLNAEPHVMEALVRIYSALEATAYSTQDISRVIGGTFGIRDIIALAALNAGAFSGSRSPEDIAKHAYLVADAMLIRRGKELLAEPVAP